jgi:hypothetical protein
VRSERVANVPDPIIIQEAGPVEPRLDVLLLLLCAIPICLLLFLLARRDRLQPDAPETPVVRELSHAWGSTSPPTLDVFGRGFEPFEPVTLFAASSLEANYSSFIPITDTQTAADGTIAASDIDLGSNLVAVNGLRLYGRGLTSGIIIEDGVLAVPPVPTTPPPTPTMPTQTPTATASPVAPPSPIPPPVPQALPPWFETYYANRDQIPPIVFTRNSYALDYKWGKGAPAAGVPADNFSAVFTRTINVSRLTNLVFTLVVEGAAKVYVDDQLVIDQWFLGHRRTHYGSVGVLPGDRVIRVEYYSGRGSASICLTWEEGFTAWAARYFNSNDLQPPVVFIRDDIQVDFSWGEGAPAPGVNPDNFSVQWERKVRFPVTGEYEFTVEADDLARVIIDSKVLADLNTWAGGGPATRTQRYRLRAGTHHMQVQFREFSGNARIKVTWRFIAPVPTEVPIILTPCPGPCP